MVTSEYKEKTRAPHDGIFYDIWGGGYIFSPAHCIQPDTPIENILTIYEQALGKKL